MVRRNVQPDTFLDWATVAELTGTPQSPASPDNRLKATVQAIYPDPLADLLQTPIRKLTAPLAVASSVLGETMYLCANDSQAATVWATGGVPYTPDEIDILWELHQAVKPEVWAERLQLIHQAKKRFQGKLEP